MTTALHQVRARRRRVRWVTLVVLVVVLAVAGALLWRWYDDPAQRAERIRGDIDRIDVVERTAVRDGVLEIVLSPGADADEIEDVYDAGRRYGVAREEAGDPAYALVRIREAGVRVGADTEEVDPELLMAAGAWEAPDGVRVEISRAGAGTTVAATAEQAPSVTTLSWLVGQLRSLGTYQLALVRELGATNDYSRTSSRVVAPEDRSVLEGVPLLNRLADVADLDPAFVLALPGEGTVTVRTEPGGVPQARARVESALTGYPDVVVEVVDD